jgi:hypothetical protein
MALTLERRRAPRTTAGTAGAHVLILDVDENWMMPAMLLNISTDGGLICLGLLVSTGRRLCLLFDRVPEAGWIDAEVVRPGESGTVGIRFLSPLSTEFLGAATSERKDRRDNAESQTPNLGDVIPTW